MLNAGKNARRRIVIPLAGLLVLTACGPVHQTVKPSDASMAQVRRLAVVVSEEGGFEVIYERAKATATGAVMFGLIGAAVSSSYNTSLDREKADAFRPALADFSFRSAFRDALAKELRESRRFAEVTVFDNAVSAAESAPYDAVATFRIHQWGLRLVERGAVEKVAAFMDLEIRMAKPSGNQVLWDEHDTAIGREKRLLSEYEEDRALNRRDLEQVAGDTGYKMAQTLIYR